MIKLENVKGQIDQFFDNISAEELYRISVEKYHFREEQYVILCQNDEFSTLEVLAINSDRENSVFSVQDSTSDLNLALAS